MPLRTPTVVMDPQLTTELRGQLLDLWFDVSKAGGSVGYTPDSPRSAVAHGLDAYFARIEAGSMHLVVVYLDERIVASCVFVENPVALQAHFMELKRFMVHPSQQGTGLGLWLADQVCGLASDVLDIESVHINVRSGESLEGFWTRCGFVSVATIPRMVKFENGEYRDLTYMQRSVK